MKINNNSNNLEQEKKKSKLNARGLENIFGAGLSNVINDIENKTVTEKIEQKIAKSGSIIEIESLKVLPNPHQPRKIFNNDEIKELSDSIKENGLLQPIIVTEGSGGFYNLVAGERRLRATKLANLKTIKAIVVDFDAKQMKELALIENIQRVDLSPIEEAIAFRDLQSFSGLTQEQLSKRVGKSRSHVANVMRLLSLPEKVQKLILNKKLTMGQAKPLVKIVENKELVNNILNRILTDNLNSRQVEKIVQLKEEPVKFKKPLVNKDITEASYVFLKNKIENKLGTKIKLDKNNLIINFHGTEDLNRILELLDLI
ncbi:ParB/RepB/Spo0J family partition protein [Spiroplasma endosymbiont of Amphibalanus improvisus]|uniref:ParB/RepB/Spo0J family partition protein n=1 Tax=Spiroplasma endosymbiont of Amphibalanus improvisus TaxID=3066327 RepID=UPI00313ECFD7